MARRQRSCDRSAVTRLLASIILSIAVPVAAIAQAQDGFIAGTVLDSTGLPLASAEVRALGTMLTTRTDERGEFRIVGLLSGESLLEARRLGFSPETLRVAVTAMRSAAIAFHLRAAATTLAAVAVRGERRKYAGRLAGYHERLASGLGGTFVTRDELDRGNPRGLTDVLRRFPGVEIVRGTRLRLRGRNCAPLVWIDGTSMPAGEVDLNSFPPSSLEGIEIYLTATAAPGRYQGMGSESRCGTVLLWSRGGDTEARRAPFVSAADRVEELHAKGVVYTRAEVDIGAQPVDATAIAVTYPPDLLAERIGGSIIAEFVVDSSGAVEAETFSVVSSPHLLFSHAVYEAIRATAFTAGKRGDRPVRQIVQMEFRFVPPAARR